ncbi:hypothetical protein LGW44_00725, partial [Streptococcus mutans]|nr:hypothetical protein [Streptococcus mutans]
PKVRQKKSNFWGAVHLIILFYHRSIISKFRKFTRALSKPEFRTFLTVSLDDRNGRMARRR